MSDTTTSGSPSSSGTTSGSRESPWSRWLEFLGKREALGTLVGWESIRRGMKNEDDLAHREALAYHQKLHGDAVAVTDDDMGALSGNMVLGHMIVNPEPKKSPKSRKLAKAALLAAGLVGAGGVGAGAMALLGKFLSGPTIVQPVNPDTDTQYEITPLPGGSK